MKLKESFTIQATVDKQSANLQESADGTPFIMPRIEAIHAGTTKNFNHYLPEKLKGDFDLKSGVYSWTSPYPKPVIYNHDTMTEATGRVMSAAYTDYTSTGKPGIIIIPKITEPNAIKAIQDGRLLTVSIGAYTDSIICSITGVDVLKDGFTGYQPGEYYDGVLCEWIIGDVWFDEVSWVNVPADENAKIIDIQPAIVSPEPVPTSESANRSLGEKFGIPRGVPITISEAQETDYNYVENNKEEEPKGMEHAENKTILEKEDDNKVVDPVAVYPEEPGKDGIVGEPGPAAPTGTPDTETTPDVPDEPKEPIVEPDTAVPTDDPVPAPVTTPVEPQTDPAPVTPVIEPTEPKAEGQESHSHVTIESLLVENARLKAQNDVLLEDLKSHYIDMIVKTKQTTSESYRERLEKRTLESLKDTLEDVTEESSITENKTARKTPATIESPVKESDNLSSKEREVSIEDKINALSSLFK